MCRFIMGNNHHKARKDANHNIITKHLQKNGCLVLDCSPLKNMFDILVGYKGKWFVMEIKDGEKPPSKRKITDGEIKCMENCKKHGNKYYVVLDENQAWNIVKQSVKDKNVEEI